jgi:hypothetical protein
MLADGTTISICTPIPYYRTDGSESAFVVTFINNNSIWLRLPGLTIKNSSTAASRQRWVSCANFHHFIDFSYI